MLAKECLEVAQRYFADSGASKREVKLGEAKSITAFEYTPKAKPEKATTGKSPAAAPQGTAGKSTDTSKSKDTKSSSAKGPNASKGGGKAATPAKAPPREPRNVICLTPQHLLIADSLEALEILLDASAKPNTSLANSDLFQQIAKSVGAYLMVDIAHIAGLIAAGLHPSPVPYADFVTTTTDRKSTRLNSSH